jgi:hypothetical protein
MIMVGVCGHNPPAPRRSVVIDPAAVATARAGRAHARRSRQRRPRGARRVGLSTSPGHRVFQVQLLVNLPVQPSVVREPGRHPGVGAEWQLYQEPAFGLRTDDGCARCGVGREHRTRQVVLAVTRERARSLWYQGRSVSRINPAGDISDWIRGPVLDDDDRAAVVLGLCSRGHRHVLGGPPGESYGACLLALELASLPLSVGLQQAQLCRLGAERLTGVEDGAPGTERQDHRGDGANPGRGDHARIVLARHGRSPVRSCGLVEISGCVPQHFVLTRLRGS